MEQDDTRAIFINTETCVGCGDCGYICPVSVYTRTISPCQNACPLGTDVPTYVSLIAQGRFTEALRSIKQHNPFPAITCRVCHHPCETQCRRTEVDEPVAIRALKRAASEFGDSGIRNLFHPPATRTEKVAIVGSGPSGLMAAHDLAMGGYQVTIFEALPVAGGMLSVGIPEFRLPSKVIEQEIAQIQEIGVRIELDTPIGKNRPLKSLFAEGYQAILMATGSHQNIPLNIPGEGEFLGVRDAVSFLREVKLDGARPLVQKAVVVGGGNAAVDSARSLIRLGCPDVSIIYRRTKAQMPAIESELNAAIEEGVKVRYKVSPAKVLGKDGRVTGLQCLCTQLGEPDSDGRPSAICMEGSEHTIDADLIIIAVGQQPDLSWVGNTSNSIGSSHLLSVDPFMMTGSPGVFAAGDLVTGPSTVIDAMASGRRAAESIDRYIQGENFGVKSNEGIPGRTDGKTQKWWAEIPKRSRQAMPEMPVRSRLSHFTEVALGLREQSAVNEARRCLGCAVFANIDSASCCGDSCRSCQYACWKGAITIR